jgi:ribosome maturation factor RimP
MYREATKLHPLLQPVVEGLGYELVGIQKSMGKHQSLLRVYIDTPGGVTVDDCERVSRQVSAVLDVEDVVPGQYVLEVSSPGLDRPLFTPEHYERFAGCDIKLTLEQLFDGRRRLQGQLLGFEGEDVVLTEEDKTYRIPYSVIGSARLVPQAVGRKRPERK